MKNYEMGEILCSRSSHSKGSKRIILSRSLYEIKHYQYPTLEIYKTPLNIFIKHIKVFAQGNGLILFSGYIYIFSVFPPIFRCSGVM